MSAKAFQIFTTLFLLFALNASATVRYVDLNSPNATPPFDDWSIAATNIQDAIDAAVDGDLVLVTNGVYATGGRVAYGSLTNRVVVDKAVTVQSVNGAASTTIQGNRGVGTNGVRCIYLTNYASLIGFTLTNGASLNAGDIYMEQSGGGAWCESTNCALINCIFVSNAVAQFGGGTFSGTCSNCLFTFNVATTGGGAFGGILNYCSLTTNSATYGGGASSNTLNYCALIANKAGVGCGAYGSWLNFCTVSGNTNAGISGTGGGMYGCVAVGCLISNNSSGPFGGGGGNGGGAYNSSLTKCMIMNNSARQGGAADICFMTNCTLSGNRSWDWVGGGASRSTLYNCMLIGNTAGGPVPLPTGVYNSTLINCLVVGDTNVSPAFNSTIRNCILYYNKTNSVVGGSLVNCCTTPLPSSTQDGGGNFTNAPLFVDLAGGDYHLQSNSPCINAGNNSYVATTTDFDGNPRIAGGTVDVGTYEYQTPSSVLSYAWAQQYGLPTDGSVDFTDTDGDGLNNWQEWIAGTIPTNASSVLLMGSPSKNVPGLKVSWKSVSGKNYFLQRSTDLAAQPAFSAIKSNLVGQAGTTVFTDTTATNAVPYFYRVGVQ